LRELSDVPNSILIGSGNRLGLPKTNFKPSSLFAMVIKCLQGSIEVVGNEDENLSVGYNLDRYMRRYPTLIAMSPVILF